MYAAKQFFKKGRKSLTNFSAHQWTQEFPYRSDWIRQDPFSQICTSQNKSTTPNPIIPFTATLPMCAPLELNQKTPSTVVVTVSIPSETIFTLPTRALNFKTTKKILKLTQCLVYNSLPSIPGIPHDTPKLFLGGFVRKDIQYSEIVRHTTTTVEGTIKDFVVYIPISCVVDLGDTLIIPPNLFGPPLRSESLPEDKLMFMNLLAHSKLTFIQISEIDDALDRIPLQGGPSEESIFTIVQEKIITLIQLQLTFPIL